MIWRPSEYLCGIDDTAGRFREEVTPCGGGGS
jgi:hypothetical protein